MRNFSFCFIFNEFVDNLSKSWKLLRDGPANDEPVHLITATGNHFQSIYSSYICWSIKETPHWEITWHHVQTITKKKNCWTSVSFIVWFVFVFLKNIWVKEIRKLDLKKNVYLQHNFITDIYFIWKTLEKPIYIVSRSKLCWIPGKLMKITHSDLKNFKEMCVEFGTINFPFNDFFLISRDFKVESSEV